jgi:hypothetical protein
LFSRGTFRRADSLSALLQIVTVAKAGGFTENETAHGALTGCLFDMIAASSTAVRF